MKLSRGLGLLAALGACWLGAAACDDGTSGPSGGDASSDAGTGGSAGKGTGGKSGGSGASSGGASSGGMGEGAAGPGGAAGKAGSADGGPAGSGPDSSTDGGGGAGGAAGGGAGGMSITDSGTHVDASVFDAATDAREAGRSGSKTCGYRCQTDDDCIVDTDATQKCDPVKKTCVDPTSACKVDGDCLAFASLWFSPCSSDDDCFPGDVCVDVRGQGLCGTPPDPVAGCGFPGQEPIVLPRFNGTDPGSDAGTASVCGSTAGRCAAGTCFSGCTSNDDCTFGTGSTCNTTTGVCECSSSTDCTASGVSTCNGQSHLCECASDDDCTSQGFDVCVAGRCGCSNASVCEVIGYKNATPVCE